uniref:C-type lectin domain-containing protein n=1 Tax=Steinernema glaseri TaxID=37863 RepID=A0A1I7YX80_9BILA
MNPLLAARSNKLGVPMFRYQLLQNTRPMRSKHTEKPIEETPMEEKHEDKSVKDKRKNCLLFVIFVMHFILLVLYFLLVGVFIISNSATSREHRELIHMEVTKAQKGQNLCEDGWHYLVISDHCVKSFERGLTWLEAQKSCAEQDASLASIHSTMENVILHNLFSPDGSNKTFWIGSSALNFDKKYGWIDGSPMKYHHFGSASLGWHFHCSIMVADNYFRWNNVDCDMKHFFICKKNRQ